MTDANFNYFKELEDKVDDAYDVAREARSEGRDPSLEPEIPVAEDMARRVEGLVGPEGVGDRIKVLDEEKGREMASFQIAKEIINGKFGDFEKEEAAEQAIRTALAIMTEGIVAAPLEGIADVKIRENKDGSEHLAIYFAGPIRSAGGTAQALSVLIGEYARSLLKLDKYEPRNDEIERYVEEIDLYERHITTLQYSPSIKEVKDVVKNVPIEITGESTSNKNVEGYKDLDRVETNGIRGGAVLVIAEGMLQKINKMLRYVNDLDMTGWEWLREFHKEKKEEESDNSDENLQDQDEEAGNLFYDKIESYDNDKYMEDFIAGRPLFGMPSERGGFRLRYGRSRDAGFATWSIHPATMAILDDFLAVGTQMKTQLPGKACITTPNDKIDGPIVRLKNGDVKKLDSFNEGLAFRDRIDKIIYLGDALVCYGEFLENNHELVPSPYVEEWWVQDLSDSLNKSGYNVNAFEINDVDFDFGFIEPDKLVKIIESPMDIIPSFDEALSLSEELDIPLHPKYLYYWKAISVDELFDLLRSFQNGELLESGNKFRFKGNKSVLEDLGIPHVSDDENVILEDPWFKPLQFLLNDLKLSEENQYLNALEFLKENLSIKIKSKGHIFVGGRMGRPEKSKERKMSPPVHVLFPIGDKGGRTRNVVEAAKHGKVKVQAAQYECSKCGTRSMQKICPNCGTETELIRYCPECGDELKEEVCPKCNVETIPYEKRELDVGKKFSKAVDNTNEEGISLVKGVEGMSSKYKIHEPLTKGVLRSKNDVYVYKDGTSRYDITDAPVTHFKPKEINISLKKLKNHGYKKDINGEPLKNKEQILELKPQDILLPDSAADYLMKVANFIDSLLVNLYNLKPYYNVEEREDLVGKLVIGLAPHTSAGVIGRILGFTRAKVGYAHPYFHAAKRRNCFHPDTKLWIKNKKGEKEHLKIKELVEKHLKPEKAKQDDFGTLYQEIEEPIYVPSINKEGQKVHKKITAVSKHIPTDHMIVITTKNGRTLRVTSDHSMVKWEENKIKKTDAKDLEIGDQIPGPMRIDLEGKEEEIDLLKKTLGNKEISNNDILIKETKKNQIKTIITELSGRKNYKNYLTDQTKIKEQEISKWINKGSIPVSILLKIKTKEELIKELPKNIEIGFKKQKTTISRKIKIENDLLTLLGHYTINGQIKETQKSNNVIIIKTSNKKSKQKIKTIIKNKFNIKPIKRTDNKIKYTDKLLLTIFEKILDLGKTHENKRIPKEVLNSPKNTQKTFLKTIFKAQNNNITQNQNIEIKITSNNLKEDIIAELRSFGINSNVKKTKKQKNQFKWIITINSKELNNLRSTDKTSNSNQKQPSHNSKSQKDKQRFETIKNIEKAKTKVKNTYSITVKETHTLVANDIYTGQCDGDEDAVMLLLDGLLNFSNYYLPNTRGGKMDAPLVITTRLDPKEVDDEVHNMDIVDHYSKEFYENTYDFSEPKEVNVEIVEDRLEDEDPYSNFKFTHDTKNISDGPEFSSYKTLGSMGEKIDSQFNVIEKLRSVDESIAAEKVIEKHFIPDLIGNLRSFSKQKMRCVDCNAKYRRIPLSGKCPKCGGKLVLTVSRGSVEKYLNVSEEIIEKYDIPTYTEHRIELIKKEIKSMFESDRQTSITDFF